MFSTRSEAGWPHITTNLDVGHGFFDLQVSRARAVFPLFSKVLQIAKLNLRKHSFFKNYFFLRFREFFKCLLLHYFFFSIFSIFYVRFFHVHLP